MDSEISDRQSKRRAKDKLNEITETLENDNRQGEEVIKGIFKDDENHSDTDKKNCARRRL